ESIHIKCGWQEVLIMARQDLKVRVCFTECWNFGVPTTHVADTILSSKDALLSGNLQLSLKIVRCLGVIGVLEKDFRQSTFFKDRLVTGLRSSLLVAET